LAPVGWGLASVFVTAFVQNGLSEELLFRGFIGKRLIAKFGFSVGNAIQAAAFGLLHGALMLAKPSLIATPLGAATVVLVVFGTGMAGFLLGHLAEKNAGGSIVPSVALHGLVNVLGYSVGWLAV
jgi:membrane protease YdiL (CAAX protease family)